MLADTRYDALAWHWFLNDAIRLEKA